MPRQKFYINETELDEFQHNLVLRNLDSSMVVSGCAGSGKSVIALHKAKAIQQSGRGTFRFIVFTVVLDKYMSDGIRTLGLNAENFTYYDDWRRHGCPLADFMIVDEAQDFTRDEILALVRGQKTCFLFGDSAQSMYRTLKPTLSIPDIVGVTGFEPKTLEFNYRLPKKIARLAALIGQGDGMADLELRCKGEGTELPHIDAYPDLTAELDAICKTIDNRHFEDVGILLPTNDAVRNAYNLLRARGRNVEARYRNGPHGQHGHMDLDFSATNSNPKLITYHSAKGLQFEAVFLPDCHTNRPSDRDVLYVALTRCYQSLYIMHTTALSTFFDPVPRDLYQTGTPKVSEKDVTI